MTVIQEGERRWYRATYVTSSVVKVNTYHLYGIGISGNPVLLASYSTRRAANHARMLHHIGYIRAKLHYKQEM